MEDPRFLDSNDEDPARTSASEILRVMTDMIDVIATVIKRRSQRNMKISVALE